MKRLGLLLCVLLTVVGLQAQTVTPAPILSGQQIQLPLSNPPVPPASVSAHVIGNAGTATYYYWVVANDPIGNSAPSKPAIAVGVPNVLDASHYVTVSWTTAPGAISYDVLRTSTAQPPAGACNCAIAIATTASSMTDQGAALQSYTVSSFDTSTAKIALVAKATGPGAEKLALQFGGADKFGFDSASGFSTANIEGIRFADRYCTQEGQLDQSCISNAIASLGGGGGTIVVPDGVYLIGSSILLPSNIDVECSQNAVFRQSPTATSDIIDVFYSSHVRIIGCDLDGNRSNNSGSFFGIASHDSTHLFIERNIVHDFRGNGIEIGTNSNHITIEGNELYNIGEALPSQNGFGISISPGDYGDGGNVADVAVIGNRVHDSNFGINIYNGLHSVSWIVVRGNSVWANADDGIRVQSFGGTTPGTISGATIDANFAWCNGWTGTAIYGCTPGFLQTGGTSSGFGVGIDLIGWSTIRNSVSGNVVDWNASDGISNDGRTYTSIDVSGTAVALHVGGAYADPFNSGWQPGEPVVIAGQVYFIASVTDPSHLTLTTNAGTQTNVMLNGPAIANNIFANNQSFQNGTTQLGGVGYWDDSADGDSFTGNIATMSWNAGFGAQHASFLAYSADRAIDNNRKNGSEDAGFYSVSLFESTYTGISAEEPSGSGYQRYGAIFDSGTSFSHIATSPGLRGSTASVLDNGSNNSWNDGSSFHGVFDADTLEQGGVKASLSSPSPGDGNCLIYRASASQFQPGSCGAAYSAQTFSNGNAQSAFPSGVTVNQLSLYAMEIPTSLQASKISYWVDAGDATTTDAYSLGVYNSSGTLVAHVAPVDWQYSGTARTDALVEGTVTLPAGMYFIGVTGDAATATLYSVCGAQKSFVDFASSSYAATTSGALPASITAPTLAPAQGCAPYIFLSK